jgi:hypothetical protein
MPELTINCEKSFIMLTTVIFAGDEDEEMQMEVMKHFKVIKVLTQVMLRTAYDAEKKEKIILLF